MRRSFPTALATYAARAVRSGRRVTGQLKAKDAMNPHAQQRRGFCVGKLPDFSTLSDNPLQEALIDNTQTPPPEQAAFRIDFPAWLDTHSKRDRRMILDMAQGERTGSACRPLPHHRWPYLPAAPRRAGIVGTLPSVTPRAVGAPGHQVRHVFLPEFFNRRSEYPMGPNPASEPRKARKAPERRIELLEPPSPSTDGWFAIRISLITATRRHTRTQSTVYLAREIPAEGMGKGCRGFEVEKLDAEMNPTGETYHVLLDSRDGYRHCDCMGCEKWSHCKHADGLAALCQAGKVKPRYRSAGDMAANDPDCLRPPHGQPGRLWGRTCR